MTYDCMGVLLFDVPKSKASTSIEGGFALMMDKGQHNTVSTSLWLKQKFIFISLSMCTHFYIKI